MARPKNTPQRRAQITDGLIRVMARRGYAGASVAHIARAAGLTPGLIHYHFKNKQEILLAALESLSRRHEERLDAALARAPDSAPDQVAAFIDLHLGLGATADPDGLACWVLLSGEALQQDAIRQSYAAATARLAARLQQIIQRGFGSGAFQDMDPAEAASAIVAAINGYFVLAAVARELVPRGSASRSVLKMAAGLLGAQVPSPPRGMAQ